MQGADVGPALALLQQARAALPGRTLLGLVDPARPPLHPAAAAALDATCANADAGRRAAPACFVALAPAGDPLFIARLLLDPALPSIGLAVPPTNALDRYWDSHLDQRVPAADLWPAARAAAPRPRNGGAIAVLAPDPDLPLCRALRRQGARVFGAEALPPLSPKFANTVFLLTNQTPTAPLLALLRRHGGAAVLLDPCLLAAYPNDARASRLASAELGRPVPHAELRLWRQGIARPAALLLGEAAAASPLFVHSGFLAARLQQAVRLPPATEHRIRAEAAGLHAESCIWAAELLRNWGIDVQLDIVGDPAEWAPLAARLGVTLGRGDRPATLTLRLAMRGQTSLAAPLAPPLIATSAVAEALDLPPGTVVLPDQPSPPLLAEAIAAALPARSGAEIAAAQLLAALRP